MAAAPTIPSPLGIQKPPAIRPPWATCPIGCDNPMVIRSTRQLIVNKNVSKHIHKSDRFSWGKHTPKKILSVFQTRILGDLRLCQRSDYGVPYGYLLERLWFYKGASHLKKSLINLCLYVSAVGLRALGRLRHQVISPSETQAQRKSMQCGFRNAILLVPLLSHSLIGSLL